ncbi:hypothetical protein [Vibrio sp. B1Z05]|uniref:hypothetical protein n=1 Tax=Vibrio sp. B1Z05 TaxID=2654980 RepID=UPI00128AF7F7|nr:hypothetical protein [Vibrio sp. B1Z05]MPW35302.1 hypothetical protein [Vibrio sp. B1Z05]
MRNCDLKSIRINGGEGIYPRTFLKFDLSDPDFWDLVQSESANKLHQIQSLLAFKPEVFEPSNNLVWETIITSANQVGISLVENTLNNMYPVENGEVSVDNLLRLGSYETNQAIYKAIGDAVSVYIDFCYKRFIDSSLSDDDYKLMMESLLCGAQLTTARYEPLISAASKLSFHEANEERKKQSAEKAKRAIELQQSLKQVHPTKSDSWLAGRVATKLTDELNAQLADDEKKISVSKKTVQRFFTEDKKKRAVLKVFI